MMASALEGYPARLRPHTKVQKSTDLAMLQMEAGAIGVTVATVWEAAAMAAAGIPDVLIANQVVGDDKLRSAAALCRHTNLSLVVDDERNVAALSQAALSAGVTMGILVDIDVGMARCGVRSSDQALSLARYVDTMAGLELRGVQAYEGHCMLEPDRETRIKLAREAMTYAVEIRQRLLDDGLSAQTLSAGGTGTYDITGHNPNLTELQAGSFVFMDAMHGNLVPGFEVSLTVLSTVMARHGDTVILDAGRKSVGIDFVSPPIVNETWVARYFAEEHALFDTSSAYRADLGDHVQLIAGYAPTTINLHDVMFVHRSGVVSDIWPVFPRGPGHHGFQQLLT
jgi:D-serine deaminase-like pyridoxal phosphate-dependent protein